jgi:pyrroline-5-carboxylate reductase
VTSKGGTTEAALLAFDASGVAAGIERGIMAAEARGRDLGDILGKD